MPEAGESLFQRIQREAAAERPCPDCGAERDYTRVWRWKDSGGFIAEGRLEMVCPMHGPFGDPGANEHGPSIHV